MWLGWVSTEFRFNIIAWISQQGDRVLEDCMESCLVPNEAEVGSKDSEGFYRGKPRNETSSLLFQRLK